MTLEERVRIQIGEGGPQLSSEAYHDRIEQELENMSPVELLRRISMALEDEKAEKRRP